MIVAISFALALFLSTALVPLAVRYAGALGLVDKPDGERKVHSQPIPRAGGIAIALAFFLPALLWSGGSESLVGFLAGGAIIALFGFLDDRHDLDYRWKFFGQILGVSLFLLGNVEITKTPFFGLGDVLPWLSYPVLMLFVLGVTNAVNLSDGLDGLAAGSSLLSLAFIALLAYGATEYAMAVIAVSAMGALTGFLRFNTHPATVFMGDTGSQFLGYVTGCLAVMVTQSSYLPVSPMLAVLILGIPILDTLLVMLLRLRDRNSPFKPDQRHLHHQFLAIGLRHYQAVAALYVLNFILLLLAYFVRYQNDWLVLAAYVFFCSTTLLGIAFFKYSAYSQLRRAKIAEAAERRNPLFRSMYWLHEYGASLVQFLLGGIWIAYMFVGSRTFGVVDIIACIGLLGGLAYWRVYKFNNRFLGRLVFYIASVLAIFMLAYNNNTDVLAWRSLTLLDIPIFGMVLLLVAVIRTTRRDHFRLDTQDMLVLLVLLAAPLLTLGSADNKILIGAIVRLAVLLYASEFLVSRVKDPRIAGAMAGVALLVFLAGSFV